MSDTWGKGAKNNTIGWGSASCTATNNWGKSQKDSSVSASWSGDTDISGCAGGVLSITYSASAFCEDGIDPTPTVTDNVGAGTFSSTAGLVFISTTTGEVDLSASTSGATYLITYTDTNSATATFSLTINDLDDASFAYSASSYSQSDADPTPTITGLSGGTFSGGSGLVFVDSGSNTGSSTGEIDLSASTVASYTITYTTAGTCPNSSTQTVGITSALAQVNNIYSMSFDALNDYIHVDDYVFSGLTSFSISFWYNLNSTSGDQAILAQYIEAPTNRGILLYHDDPNGWAFYINTNTGLKSFESTFTATASVWQHLVVTYESGVGIKIYLNGTAQSSGTLSGTTVNPTPSEFTIGRDGASGSFTRFLNGKLDELGIFNTALTSQEVQSIYNATETGKTADLNDLTTPPIAWYRM